MKEQEIRERYYNSFLSFLQAVGAYESILKMSINIEEGIYPVQIVAYQYGYRGSKLDQEISDRHYECYERLKVLNYWSQKAGFLPMDNGGMDKVFRFVEDEPRRRYLRDNIRRALKKGELLSVRDLMLKRYAVERKQQLKKAEG